MLFTSFSPLHIHWSVCVSVRAEFITGLWCVYNTCCKSQTHIKNHRRNKDTKQTKVLSALGSKITGEEKEVRWRSNQPDHLAHTNIKKNSCTYDDRSSGLLSLVPSLYFQLYNFPNLCLLILLLVVVAFEMFLFFVCFECCFSRFSAVLNAVLNAVRSPVATAKIANA